MLAKGWFCCQDFRSKLARRLSGGRLNLAIECKGFEPFNVKTLHLIPEKRLKTLAVTGFQRYSASPIYICGRIIT
jgi:hypothetical protein